MHLLLGFIQTCLLGIRVNELQRRLNHRVFYVLRTDFGPDCAEARLYLLLSL